MFDNIINIFKRAKKKEHLLKSSSKETAKERLHLVLMQDRANVSADFLDLMRQEIIEVIKKYIDIDEKAMDVRLTNESSDEGTQGAPALYANIPIINIKDEIRKMKKKEEYSIENGINIVDSNTIKNDKQESLVFEESEIPKVENNDQLGVSENTELEKIDKEENKNTEEDSSDEK